MNHAADCSGCPECRLPRRGSGGPSEAYYRARGYQALKVRLPIDTIDLLDRLVEAVDDEEERRDMGEPKASRARVLDALLRCAPAADELAAALRLRNQGSER